MDEITRASIIEVHSTKDAKDLLSNLVSIGGYCPDCSFSNKFDIIWPVVPKEFLTAIHFAQIKLIKNLVNNHSAGRVIIMWSELYCEESVNSEHFLSNLIDCLKRNKVSEIEKKPVSFSALDKSSENIFCKVNMFEMLKFKNKNFLKYGETDPELEETSTAVKVQKYIRPLLQIESIRGHIQNATVDHLVIAGSDEMEQWSKLRQLAPDNKKIEIALIPEMKRDGRTAYQTDDAISCKDKDNLIEYLKDKGASDWFYKMFIKLTADGSLSDSAEYNFETIWEAIKQIRG